MALHQQIHPPFTQVEIGFRELLDLLHELSLPMLTLTRLVRTQLWVDKDEGGNIQKTILRAIAETADEMGISM